MSQALDDLVQQSLNAKKAAAIADLEAQRQTIEDQITSDSLALNKQADQLAGFKIGIIAPAYQGDVAGSLIRDPLGLGVDTGYPVDVVGTTPAPTSTFATALLIGAAMYFGYEILKRRH